MARHEGPHRPQTLRQARRAYLKSGGQRRLSPTEQAVLDRQIVLEERAERIREREARRKANLAKRKEKREAELERRRTSGPVEPDPPTASQLQLGRFLAARPVTTPDHARPPLQAVHHNIQAKNDTETDLDAYFASNSQIERELASPAGPRNCKVDQTKPESSFSDGLLDEDLAAALDNVQGAGCPRFSGDRLQQQCLQESRDTDTLQSRNFGGQERNLSTGEKAERCKKSDCLEKVKNHSSDSSGNLQTLRNELGRGKHSAGVDASLHYLLEGICTQDLVYSSPELEPARLSRDVSAA